MHLSRVLCNLIHFLRVIMLCFCCMIDLQKAFSLILSQDHCKRSSLSQIPDRLQAGFEPTQNLSSSFVEVVP